MKKTFIFESYEFDTEMLLASFTYSFDHQKFFTERVQFEKADANHDKVTLDRTLFLAFALIGVSYYKLFPGGPIQWNSGATDVWQGEFLNHVYQEGLSQFAFENQLERKDLGQFEPTNDTPPALGSYAGEGLLTLQSGGKDSLLTATSLQESGKQFDSLYITSSGTHPAILDTLPGHLYVARRTIDIDGIKAAKEEGGLNGHIPVTYVVLSLALIQAVLLNKNVVLSSIGHEGEEPHDWIGNLAVTHQWSKTWEAEELFADYVTRYIADTAHVGSALRRYSELRVAELFVKKCWAKYGHSFSSCNRANYLQGTDNTDLKWCGECPKCANSYLLFAPFLEPAELRSIFAGQDLFEKPLLEETFKGLLGIDGVIKPFECVGEIDELRLAYHKGQEHGGYAKLPFEVPASNYDYMQTFPAQYWAAQILELKYP
jgi:UDP-N-acetyl-alpha-D-muramoyl-L-alanyl-L-glutamate epimerase